MNAFITQLGIYMKDYRLSNLVVQMTLMAVLVFEFRPF